MKKRMFLTTVLMALVLLVAVTTATFAWYQATTTGNITGGTDAHTVQTSGDAYQVGDLVLTIVFGEQELKDLGPVDAEGHVKFVSSENKVVYDEMWNDASQTYYDVLASVSWTLKATIGGSDATADDLKAYVGTKFTVTIDAEKVDGVDYLKLADSEPAAGYVANDGTISYEVQIDANGAIVAVGADDKVDGTVYVSIHENWATKSGTLTLNGTVAAAQ